MLKKDQIEIGAAGLCHAFELGLRYSREVRSTSLNPRSESWTQCKPKKCVSFGDLRTHEVARENLGLHHHLIVGVKNAKTTRNRNSSQVVGGTRTSSHDISVKIFRGQGLLSIKCWGALVKCRVQDVCWF